MSVLMVLSMFFGAALTVHAADSFSDVPKNAWYHEAVNFVQADGLMNGTGNGKFSPNAKINRAMFVTILYRLAGSPENPKESDFSDVPENRYYSKTPKPPQLPYELFHRFPSSFRTLLKLYSIYA